jgi:hypothetical protein
MLLRRFLIANCDIKKKITSGATKKRGPQGSRLLRVKFFENLLLRSLRFAAVEINAGEKKAEENNA